MRYHALFNGNKVNKIILKVTHQFILPYACNVFVKTENSPEKDNNVLS